MVAPDLLRPLEAQACERERLPRRVRGGVGAGPRLAVRSVAARHAVDRLSPEAGAAPSPARRDLAHDRGHRAAGGRVDAGGDRQPEGGYDLRARHPPAVSASTPASRTPSPAPSLARPAVLRRGTWKGGRASRCTWIGRCSGGSWTKPTPMRGSTRPGWPPPT